MAAGVTVRKSKMRMSGGTGGPVEGSRRQPAGQEKPNRADQAASVFFRFKDVKTTVKITIRMAGRTAV
jgi:hypothetical protein